MHKKGGAKEWEEGRGEGLDGGFELNDFAGEAMEGGVGDRSDSTDGEDYVEDV